MGRVEQESRLAMLRALTASKPLSLVMSRTAFRIMSLVIFGVGGIVGLLSGGMVENKRG